MTDRVALVTGSSSGIGAQVTRRLAAEGYAVVVDSRASPEQGQAVADEVGCTYVQADVGEPDEGRRLVTQVLQRQGRLDVLVNNAGTTARIRDAIRERVRATAPLRRSGTPDDVAEVVLALVRSTYVTGQVVTADGGMTLMA